MVYRRQMCRRVAPHRVITPEGKVRVMEQAKGQQQQLDVRFLTNGEFSAHIIQPALMGFK